MRLRRLRPSAPRSCELYCFLMLMGLQTNRCQVRVGPHRTQVDPHCEHCYFDLAAGPAKAVCEVDAGGSDGAIYTNETYDAIKLTGLAFVDDAELARGQYPDSDLLGALKKIGVNYDGASGVHTFDSAGDVLGTGYEVCQFAVSGATVNFSCPTIWTADGGLSDG
mgnify:CR=1 FL=1